MGCTSSTPDAAASTAAPPPQAPAAAAAADEEEAEDAVGEMTRPGLDRGLSERDKALIDAGLKPAPAGYGQPEKREPKHRDSLLVELGLKKPVEAGQVVVEQSADGEVRTRL